MTHFTYQVSCVRLKQIYEWKVYVMGNIYAGTQAIADQILNNVCDSYRKQHELSPIWLFVTFMGLPLFLKNEY